MRCDQIIGLNERARKLVQGDEVLLYEEAVIRVYPDGKKTVEPFKEVMGPSSRMEDSEEWFSGMFGDAYPLHKYVFPDGSFYQEYVQADPWSSGPMFFLALKSHKGEVVEESLWTEDEIEGYQ